MGRWLSSRTLQGRWPEWTLSTRSNTATRDVRFFSVEGFWVLEQLQVHNSRGLIVRMRTGLHVTRTNGTTQLENHIFEWKDIGGKVPSDSPTRLEASMRPQTQDNDRNKDWTSTEVDAVSISTFSEDSDGPMTASSGKDAVLLSDSRLGSEVLEVIALVTQCTRTRRWGNRDTTERFHQEKHCDPHHWNWERAQVSEARRDRI